MSNIIKFPKEYKTPVETTLTQDLPSTQEEKTNMINNIRTEYISDLMVTLMPQIYSAMQFGGFQLTEEFGERDWCFVSDAIEAMLYRGAMLKHPLHEFIDQEWDASQEIEEVPENITMEDIKKDLNEKSKPKRQKKND